MNHEIFKSLEKVVKYLYDDEQKHWEEDGKPKDHIFTHVNLLDHWVRTVKTMVTGENHYRPEEPTTSDEMAKLLGLTE
jgi:hypothetical protein